MGLKIGKASVPIVADAQDFRYPHPHPRMHSVCTRMQGFRAYKRACARRLRLVCAAYVSACVCACVGACLRLACAAYHRRKRMQARMRARRLVRY